MLSNSQTELYIREKTSLESKKKTHQKPTETQTFLTSCDPLLHIWMYKSLRNAFQESLSKFKTRIEVREQKVHLLKYPLLVGSQDYDTTETNKKEKVHEQILPFVKAYDTEVINPNQILIQKQNLIFKKPLLKTVFRERSFISYK